MHKRVINTNYHTLVLHDESVVSFPRKSILSASIVFCCIISFFFLEEVHAQSASNITSTSADVSGYCGTYYMPDGTTEVKYSGTLWLPNNVTASVPAGGSVTVPLTGLLPGTSYGIGLTCRCDPGQPAALCNWMCANMTWGCGWAADSSFTTKSCESDACCWNSNPCCASLDPCCGKGDPCCGDPCACMCCNGDESGGDKN